MDAPIEKQIYSVSQLNREAKLLLESQFPSVLIQGEISNFVQPSSGHFYFTLKDDKGQIRCAMFRGNNRRLSFAPENGQQVVISAKLSLYEGRGDYQLIVNSMELAGDGALARAFDELKKRLQKEGLFDQQHKKTIPTMPQTIGIITSPTGAAVRDILTTLKRRFPVANVVIYPSQVQGSTATALLCQAIETANTRDECDILLLARGGGSLEDLWCFNEETVARAIFASPIPIVCGVGHEIDFTIADFVADARAATPTAAAELITPDRVDTLEIIAHKKHQLTKSIRGQLQNLYQIIDFCEKRLKSPYQQLQEYQRQLDFISHGLKKSQHYFLSQLHSTVMQTAQKLQHNAPQHQIQNYQHQLLLQLTKMKTLIKQQLSEKKSRFGQLITALDAISPLATLQRGYSIVTDSNSGVVLRSAKNCHQGDKITAKLAEGQLYCEIIETDY